MPLWTLVANLTVLAASVLTLVRVRRADRLQPIRRPLTVRVYPPDLTGTRPGAVGDLRVEIVNPHGWVACGDVAQLSLWRASASRDPGMYAVAKMRPTCTHSDVQPSRRPRPAPIEPTGVWT